MPNYVECPFCLLLFEDPEVARPDGKTDLMRHVEQDHHKVRVRKGSNYRWVDAKEIKRRLEETEKILARGRR